MSTTPLTAPHFRTSLTARVAAIGDTLIPVNRDVRPVQVLPVRHKNNESRWPRSREFNAATSFPFSFERGSP